MEYKHFQKLHPEWPKLAREVVGRKVRTKHKLETRGGKVFRKGSVLIIFRSWRGRLGLMNGRKWPNARSITRIHPSEVELLQPESIVWRNKEAFILFCVSVAGKKSRPTQRRVEKLLEVCAGKFGRPDFSPFSHIGDLLRTKGELRRELKRLGFGQYTKLVKAFTELVTSDIDLDRCRTQDLERIHGIGPKTSRYFIMRTRSNANVAALDTHILRWLSDIGHCDIPSSTPQSMTTYRRVEGIFLAEAKKRRKRPSRLDAEIWERYSKYSMSTGERSQVDEVAAFV